MDLALTAHGQGTPVVFVHGTPSSSFEFREVIAQLAPDHRCLAPDHLGFGRSPKPLDGDYRLVAHQQRFREFIVAQDVQDAVFVLHDFGTAIALPVLLEEPARCRGIVLLNTFLWPASGPVTWVLRAYSTPFGRWCYRTFNVSVGVLLPYAWGRRKPLTAELKAAYQAFLPTAEARIATSAFGAELVGDTLAQLAIRAGELGQFPIRAVWGGADRLVGPAELARWRGLLPGLEVEVLDEVGHFVAEEAPDEVAAAIRAVAATRSTRFAEAG